MRLKTKIIIATVPVVVTVTAVAVRVITKKLIPEHKEKKMILPGEVRAGIEEIIWLKAEDFVPDGLGTSLYQRKLSTMSDKQLIGIYAIVKVGDVMRQRGVDPHMPTIREVDEAIKELRAMTATKQGRREILSELGSIGFEVAQGAMRDGLMYVGLEDREMPKTWR
jgi:hypothetical protein